MKGSLGLIVFAGVAGLVACGGSGSSKGSAPGSGGSASVEIGVPECDDYLNKYEACINSKVPESARPMAKQTLDQNRAAWKQAAANPQAKAALATGCKAAFDMAKTAMTAYGCSW